MYCVSKVLIMGTITINIKDDVEQEFRSIAGIVYGKNKGHLGKAFTEAIQDWIYERKQEKIAREALELMNQDFSFGGRLYQHRSELHER